MYSINFKPLLKFFIALSTEKKLSNKNKFKLPILIKCLQRNYITRLKSINLLKISLINKRILTV